MLITLLNIVDHFLNDIVRWNGMELNSYIWDNVWTDVCCVLSIDAYVVIEISEFHWWSMSHILRYQVVKSWWGSSCTLWHISNKCINVIKNKFTYVKYNNSFVCEVCHFAKQKRLSFPISTSKSKKYFDLIHVDIWGPYSIPSIHGHKYFLTIVDDYSGYTWIFLLKQKSEVVKVLENCYFCSNTVWDNNKNNKKW